MTAVYTHPRCLDHHAPGHPERPERLKAALKALEGLPIAHPAVAPVDVSVVTLVHEERHARRIEDLANSGGGWLDPDTFVGPVSYEAALSAAGATVQAMQGVLGGQEANALALVRPPGHHATRHRAMGFCLFNNGAIAVQWAIETRGVQRIAIVDLDVHHGNGTEEIFYYRPDVLYCSVHQYPHYPGTGALQDVGAAEGQGTTINVPLMAGCGDATYLAVTDRVIVPALRRFQPEGVLVSLGFDAHWADPLASMRLSVRGYAEMLERLVSVAAEQCDGRVVLLLEGGYDLQVLEEGVRAAAAILVGEPVPPDRLGLAPRGVEPEGASHLIDAVRAIHGLG